MTPAARELAEANRILYDNGVVDAFGHVSVRHEERADRFLLAANAAPALVDALDILEFDLDGRPTHEGGQRLYAERFIHSEIYRARPDVRAVVHSHSPAVLPFCVTRAEPLRPVWHMSGFLGTGAAWYEIREFAGLASDLLVKSRELGASLAHCLGPHAVVLMRGHGSTVVGPSLRVAVYRAVYTELNAKVQAAAHRLGPPIFLEPGEAQATAAANEAQVDRAWELWRSRAASNTTHRRPA